MAHDKRLLTDYTLGKNDCKSINVEWLKDMLLGESISFLTNNRNEVYLMKRTSIKHKFFISQILLIFTAVGLFFVLSVTYFTIKIKF